MSNIYRDKYINELTEQEPNSEYAAGSKTSEITAVFLLLI